MGLRALIGNGRQHNAFQQPTPVRGDHQSPGALRRDLRPGFHGPVQITDFPGAPARHTPADRGPSPPMRRLVDLLQLLRGIEGSAYAWSDPVMLSDEVVVLAF